MMRSLYSGVSGLRTHQVRMDVIGANLANVNTVGFKSSRVTFRDILYQTSINATAPNEDGAGAGRGGVNPSQIGLGVQLSSIDVLNTRAGPMLTDKPFDCYIDGEGYFMVIDSNGVEYFTRVGDFSLDSLGYLVDGNGNFVMGLSGRDSADPADPTFGVDELSEFVPIRLGEDPEEFQNYTQVSIGLDGIIRGYDTADEEDPVHVLGQVILFKFINNDGLSHEGNTYVRPTANSGVPTAYSPGVGGVGRVITNRLEMSNVELSREFTDMIVTQRGFQANSRIITVSDEMLQELVNLKR
ncbi:MAG: flagellar hook-basal body complex protein [Oscillospiraceae bacterium]|nr:flagellar hook-basal body complex protein [Oscillospiraceae bacterium]